MRCATLPRYCVFVFLIGLFLLAAGGAASSSEQSKRWIERVSHRAPCSSAAGICAGVIGALPEINAQASLPGKALLRVPVPFSPGALPESLGLEAVRDGVSIPVDLRVLTLHPGMPRSVRQGMLSFVHEFTDTSPTRFQLRLCSPRNDSEKTIVEMRQNESGTEFCWGKWKILCSPSSVKMLKEDGQEWDASLIAPPRDGNDGPVAEVIESGTSYAWVRLLVPDARWPRIIELQLDALGHVTVRAQLQRMEKKDGVAPDIGWEIVGLNPPESPRHEFASGSPHPISCDRSKVDFPSASLERRGWVEARNGAIRFLRCTAAENVPFQESAWRSAAFSLFPVSSGSENMEVKASATSEAQASQTDLSRWRALESLQTYMRRGLLQSALQGDDFGNVTVFQDGEIARKQGMNRLNHCPPVFEAARKNGDTELMELALNWCVNMHDLSLWWGEGQDFGGTRYNNAAAANEREPDPAFMWRTNSASNFCTKGYDSFFYAYEETGDPRMAAALRAQVAYARERVHTDQGECRNIGDVADFVRLHRATGEDCYLEEALRLFRELRTKLSEGNLFSQGGEPIVPALPFIDDDEHGYKHPFAKPYIIGYALAGLPGLLELRPEEPRLRDVVRAVADFLADCQDPLGGWRYPHSQSSRVLLGQAMEHAAQLTQAARVLERRGEDIANLLDAIENVLRCQVVSVARTGKMAATLNGWESVTGVLSGGKTIYDLYQTPPDRPRERDYREGTLDLGEIPPEGLVYLQEVMGFYLQHRPAERLLHSTAILDQVFERVPGVKPYADAFENSREYDTYGMKALLPKFHDAANKRLGFSMAWPVAGMEFGAWRAQARGIYRAALQSPPPPAAFQPCVLEVEDRGSYEARKLAFNVSADSRILGYLLVPRGEGPFPAVLAMHDHGAHFSIGKEKVIRPFGVSEERMQDAQNWVGECYGGRWFGDELAQRGYVVFATDALFWGDRGRAEGVAYTEQQTLAANLLQLGMSWAGDIVWDDLRGAEFLRSLPEVRPERVGCAGLSMGAHRTWSLMALTDMVQAGAAICWMGDTRTLLAEGNNQTRGQSAFSMLHPGLRVQLDFPDVASLACPKPMLFFNGEQDGLFPVEGVEACYEKLRRVWESQAASDKLVTKIWPVPHVFNVEMQEAAFQWLDTVLKRNP